MVWQVFALSGRFDLIGDEPSGEEQVTIDPERVSDPLKVRRSITRNLHHHEFVEGER